jgi:FtsH-binding integral membrane protein
MKSVRYLATGLLALTGAVHVAQLLTVSNNPIGPSVITALFGIAYLAIAFFIYRENKRALWFGAIVPLVGLLLTLPGMFAAPTALSTFFVVVDAIVVGCCVYLIYKSK